MFRFLLAAPFLCVFAIAQQDMGVITGLVTDSSGGAVPGARVAVLNIDTNEARAAETSATGAYTVGPLRIGNYRVTVEHQGFKISVRNGIQVSAQDRLRADFELQVGQLTETVSVTAETPLLQAEQSSLSHVVEQEQIRGLPLNSRNFQQLAWMSAGVSPAPRGRDRDSGFNSHGQQTTQNNFIIDGVDNNNNIMGMQDRKAQVVIPSLDAVSEFKVQTSNYSAEFGRNSGAVMIVSIKSGTNAFHGTAFEYLRNDKTDARDMFSYIDRTGDGKADPDVLKQNQFGVTLGGPIKRDRTFFFGSWERRTQRRAQSDSATVPTVEERNGIFSTKLATVTDPTNANLPFPNNTIPRSRFDATAVKMIELWPSPNFSGSGTRSNYISGPAWINDRDQYDWRVDHSLTERDKIFGRFSKNNIENVRGAVFAGPARGGQANDRAIDSDSAHTGAFSWTHILSPSLVNEFRYGFIRQKADKHELTEELSTDLNAKYGIRGVPPIANLRGLPIFGFAGGINYTGFGEPGSMPNFKIHQVHQWLDNVSWNHGNHSYKAGVDLRWNRSDIFGGDAGHGNFQFDGTFTKISMADFLLGQVTSFTTSTQLPGQMRFRNYMLYAQDDWKVTPKLTVNYGMRYELTSPWYEKHNNQSTLNLAPGADFNKIVLAGSCGDSWSCRGLVDSDKNNFAPRLGFAYQWNRKTVIRSGVGVFYGGQGSLGANSRMISNFPFYRSATIQSAASKPAFVLAGGVPDGILGSTDKPANNLNWSVWAKDFPEPIVYQWNFTIQHELAKNLSLTTAYIGSASNYIMSNYNWNGSAPGLVATEQARRRIPQWNAIDYVNPYGHSNYNGLDVQLDRRWNNGLAATFAYTWSHSLDNVTEQFGAGGGGLSDFRNFNSARASSNFDLRHRGVGSVVYEIPFFKRNRYFGGWEFSTLVSKQTGHYFAITVPNARQRLGATGVGTWWPDRIGDPRIDNPTTQRWFDTTAFVLPRRADGTWYFGNAGRSILASDGPFNWDAGLTKNFRITERFALQFRGEVFNLTNTPTLDDPIVNIDSPDFGRVTGTSSTPRQMQFSLRLRF